MSMSRGTAWRLVSMITRSSLNIAHDLICLSANDLHLPQPSSMSAPAPKRVCQIIKVCPSPPTPSKRTNLSPHASYSSRLGQRQSTPGCTRRYGQESSRRSRAHTSRTTRSTTRRRSGCSSRTLRIRARTSRATCAAWARTRRRAAGGRSLMGCRRASMRLPRGAAGRRSGGRCVGVSSLLNCGRVWLGCAHGYRFFCRRCPRCFGLMERLDLWGNTKWGDEVIHSEPKRWCRELDV